jgi:ABC-type multidrug transport system ATPase subunit
MDWQNITVSVTDQKWPWSRKVNETYTILRDISGSAKVGSIVGIMGPSGSGKTTLLMLLAEELHKNSGLTASGTIRMLHTGPSAFVMQTGSQCELLSHLTVNETLRLFIDLKIGQASETERRAEFERLLSLMRLHKCSNSYVCQLSGGELKRLTIAVEIIGNSTLRFFDEPTSGLDSFQALEVMQSLRSMADSGCTIFVSLHQPRETIFGLLDTLVLLSAKGETLYSGPVKELATYLKACDLPIPIQCNPADYLLDLASARNDADAIKLPVFSGMDKSAESGPLLSNPPSHLKTDTQPCAGSSWWQQTRLLTIRSLRQASRQSASYGVLVKLALTFFVPFMVGRSSRQASPPERLKISQFFFLTLLPGVITSNALSVGIDILGEKRALVQRELAHRKYHASAYIAAESVASFSVAAAPALLCGMLYPVWLRPGFAGRFTALLLYDSLAHASVGVLLGSGLSSRASAVAREFLHVVSQSVYMFRAIPVEDRPSLEFVTKAAAWLPKKLVRAVVTCFKKLLGQGSTSDCLVRTQFARDRFLFKSNSNDTSVTELFKNISIRSVSIAMACTGLAFVAIKWTQPQAIRLRSPPGPTENDITTYSK